MNKPNRLLVLNNGYWHYQRRVPAKFKHIEPRSLVRTTLGTQSLEIARLRRDALVEADDNFWTSLALEAAENGGVSKTTYEVELHRYKAACSSTMLYGFTYKPVKQLVKHSAVEELLERTETLSRHYNEERKLPLKETQALLGGVRHPKTLPMKVSDVFKLYVDEIAHDAQVGKSPKQQYSWMKSKRTSIGYFVEAIGDLNIFDINREHALEYRNWWIDRMANGDEKGMRPKPYTANRHIGSMRSLYGDFFDYKGVEDRSNPFKKIRFKDDKKTETPVFDDEYVRTRILARGMFDGIRPELRHIIYTLIETGARPSEICNLKTENIHLDVDVPYVSIRPSENRELKTIDSKRDIPLVGVALEAMRLAPQGFPKYYDKGELVSANLMKAFRKRDLFPTKDHVIYSFRHSFEKRMLEAGLDYDLRLLLMGHKNTRPKYGDGGSLEYRRDELLKIVHPHFVNLVT